MNSSQILLDDKKCPKKNDSDYNSYWSVQYNLRLVEIAPSHLGKLYRTNYTMIWTVTYFKIVGPTIFLLENPIDWTVIKNSDIIFNKTATVTTEQSGPQHTLYLWDTDALRGTAKEIKVTVQLRNECLFFWVHGEGIAARGDKQIG